MSKKFLSVLLVLVCSIGFSQKLREKVVVNTDMFTIHYSEVLQQPTYVEYTVMCTETKFSRDGLDFFVCDSIKTSDNEDYANNPYDKGHMAPAADFNCDKEKLKNTFTYLNCALQEERLNRGVWRFLEARERTLAKTDKVNVKITIHFSKTPQKVPGGATIPEGFTKVIQYGKIVETYYFPNVTPTKKTYSEYKTK